MLDKDFNVITSVTKSVRGIIKQYTQDMGHPPRRILLNPVLHAMWRAELLVQGKLMPGDSFVRFEGLTVEINEGVRVCELR